jgi:hypothetical protein
VNCFDHLFVGEATGPRLRPQNRPVEGPQSWAIRNTADLSSLDFARRLTQSAPYLVGSEMFRMDRRKFLTTSLGAAAACTCSGRSALAESPGLPRPVAVDVDPSKTLGAIPENFIGLGYEISSVAQAGLLSPRNAAYIQFVKNLGARGVIRIGGNTSDYSSYSASGPAVSSPKATVVDDASLRDLGGFLRATGWELIWGLNLGGGTVENGLDEAASVIAAAGDNLLALEIGNEPDLFAGGVAHRPRGYSYADYLKEYRAFKSSLRAKFPKVPLAGPDAANHTDWVGQFATDEGKDIKLLTHHYYAEGPPTNPASTIENLLETDPKLGRILDQCTAAAGNSGVPFRICETNSCFGGGKPGVSDTLASALWGLDFLFTLAWAGSAGVNIETGVNQLGFVSSYSPIFDDLQGHYTARPIYYAMLAFGQASRGVKVGVKCDTNGLSVKVYATKEPSGRVCITLISKETRTDAAVTVKMSTHAKRATVLHLGGPSLDSKTGVTLGGAEVDADGRWKRPAPESAQIRHGSCDVLLAAASAAVVIVEK